jgi:crossover junction endodeoxyribonuclease RuvC
VIILGVDPGLSGGLALVKRDDVTARCTLIAVVSIPTTGDKAKRRVDVASVLDFLRSVSRIDHAFIERAQAMPKQGSSSGFIYGRAVGALEACVDGMVIPSTIIEAVHWKKAHGLLKREKEDSRQRAIKLFPGSRGFELKGHHNRAEAALIAWYGILTLVRVAA